MIWLKIEWERPCHIEMLINEFCLICHILHDQTKSIAVTNELTFKFTTIMQIERKMSERHVKLKINMNFVSHLLHKMYSGYGCANRDDIETKTAKWRLTLQFSFSRQSIAVLWLRCFARCLAKERKKESFYRLFRSFRVKNSSRRPLLPSVSFDLPLLYIFICKCTCAASCSCFFSLFFASLIKYNRMRNEAHYSSLVEKEYPHIHLHWRWDRPTVRSFLHSFIRSGCVCVW